MKKMVVVMMSLMVSSMAFAAKPAVRCQKAVEKQEDGLASESSATPEDKAVLLEQLRNGDFEVTEEEYTLIESLLERKDTLAFSFGNDAGAWLTIANAKTCKVLDTTQLVAH